MGSQTVLKKLGSLFKPCCSLSSQCGLAAKLKIERKTSSKWMKKLARLRRGRWKMRWPKIRWPWNKRKSNKRTSNNNGKKNNSRSRYECPAGYVAKSGDIPGWGRVGNKGGGQRVSSCRNCASLCATEAACLSYECSPTERKCNLNTARSPTHPSYKD